MKPPTKTILWWWERKPKRAVTLFTGTVFAGLLFLPVAAHADCHHPKCSVDLQRSPEQTTKVIIQYNADTDATDEVAHSDCQARPEQGVSSVVVGAGPAHAVYFATYESVKHAMGGNEGGNHEHHPLAAGMPDISFKLRLLI